jgi:hypothetical protein
MSTPDQPATDWTTRIVLGLVMVAALAVGTWSVYSLLRELLHAPKAVAFFGCLMFDGAALFFARLAQRYATTSDSGLAPRAAMLVMISASSWVNWQHAQLKNWGTVGSVILAAAPVIAELAFEMWHRFEHREALRRRGRVAEALPVLGKWAWLMHPRRSRCVVDSHVQARLTEVEAIADRREAAAVSGDADDRITVERDDTPPASPTPQHVVIEVRQTAALPAADTTETATAAPSDTADTGRVSAGHPTHVLPSDAGAASGDALQLEGLTKAEAVMRIKRAYPEAPNGELVKRLAQHGVDTDTAYVRTALARAKKRAAERGEGFYP